MAQCQGPRTLMLRLFLVFYIRLEHVAKIPKVPGARGNSMASRRNHLLYHFFFILSVFLQKNTFEKKVARGNAHWTNY